MYPIIIAVLMLLAPAVSILSGLHGASHLSPALLCLRWSVFWMVGVRLLLAGIRQVLQPRYTATAILGIEHADSLVLVRELGFANLALGVVGLGSLLSLHWTAAGAAAGAIFYGLAGLNHLRTGQRTVFARIAMVSDLWAFVVLGTLLGVAEAQGGLL